MIVNININEKKMSIVLQGKKINIYGIQINVFMHFLDFNIIQTFSDRWSKAPITRFPTFIRDSLY